HPLPGGLQHSRTLPDHGALPMVKIEAIIRPERLEAVLDALEMECVTGITVANVRGAGHEPDGRRNYRGAEYIDWLHPRVKIEAIVPGWRLSLAVLAIQAAARTGVVGDGLILVLPVNDAVRVRTGERGEPAIV